MKNAGLLVITIIFANGWKILKEVTQHVNPFVLFTIVIYAIHMNVVIRNRHVHGMGNNAMQNVVIIIVTDAIRVSHVKILHMHVFGTKKVNSIRNFAKTHFSPKTSRKRYHIEVPKRVSLVHAVSLFQTTTNPVPRGHNYRVYRENASKE